jgi:hypothetical protein
MQYGFGRIFVLRKLTKSLAYGLQNKQGERMSAQRRSKSWFEIEKVVIDDYGSTIGAHGVAVYVCLVRMCEARHDGSDFELKDLATMLALEQPEIDLALTSLVSVGALGRTLIRKADGTTYPLYSILSLAGEYYGMSTDLPEQVTNPKIQDIPAKNTPKCKGFVYIVEGEGYFKIGCTKDIYQRVKALAVKAPFALAIRVIIPSLDMYGTESELHRRFAEKHRRGEWFNLEPTDIVGICRDYQTLSPAFLSTE